jgi:hypothetical protein
MTVLSENFIAASPRGKDLPTPLASWLIHGAVLALFVVLAARAFGAPGVLSWACGLVYVGAFRLGSSWRRITRRRHCR